MQGHSGARLGWAKLGCAAAKKRGRGATAHRRKEGREETANKMGRAACCALLTGWLLLGACHKGGLVEWAGLIVCKRLREEFVPGLLVGRAQGPGQLLSPAKTLPAHAHTLPLMQHPTAVRHCCQASDGASLLLLRPAMRLVTAPLQPAAWQPASGPALHRTETACPATRGGSPAGSRAERGGIQRGE